MGSPSRRGGPESIFEQEHEPRRAPGGSYSWPSSNPGTRSSLPAKICARAAARRLRVRRPPRPRPGRAGARRLPEARAVLRPHVPDREPDGPRRAGVLRRLSGDQGRDLGRLQPDHPVRRRQDARADAALPPRQRRPGGRKAGREWRRSSTRPASRRCPGPPTAVFVGTEFDSITGRGGNDGTPLRRTPWGEIAFQLGGAEGFAVVAEHDEEGIAPAAT